MQITALYFQGNKGDKGEHGRPGMPGFVSLSLKIISMDQNYRESPINWLLCIF